MKVVFDHQIFCIQNVGGISRYFSNIIKYINSHQSDIQGELSVRYSDNIYLKNLSHDTEAPPWFLKNNFIGKKFLLERINRFYTNQLIEKIDFDVFFPTYYSTYFLDKIKQPYVLTVHDMTHERFPEIFYKNKDFTLHYKRKAIEQATHLIAISENTKKDLLEYYNVPEEKISVIYHGIEQDYLTQPFAELHAPFFLFVGERGGYKNFEIVLRALSTLQNESIHLICTGKSFSKSEIEQLKKYGLSDRVKALHLTDSQLNYLYENAAALVYPSLYEGFGYPLLEAMRANCVVITSNTSCLPEIGGDAALYFNPLLVEELTEKMQYVLNLSENEKSDTVSKGSKNLLRFSLKESMTKTIDVLKGVASKKV
jgi:glycosyltransferase involved in cell wall biosynthesis